MVGSSMGGKLFEPQTKIKQEPIMAVGNKNQNYKQSNRDQFKKKWNYNKDKNRAEKKTCTGCGRTFGEGHLKICPAMGKSSKSCNKPIHFAKMCRSNQVNEIAEENSEEECNLIRSFDSCEEFEIMAVEPKLQVSDENFDKLISDIERDEMRLDTKDVRKIDIGRDLRSHKKNL